VSAHREGYETAPCARGLVARPEELESPTSASVDICSRRIATASVRSLRDCGQCRLMVNRRRDIPNSISTACRSARCHPYLDLAPEPHPASTAPQVNHGTRHICVSTLIRADAICMGETQHFSHTARVDQVLCSNHRHNRQSMHLNIGSQEC
jgi:hypothetical protein